MNISNRRSLRCTILPRSSAVEINGHIYMLSRLEFNVFLHLYRNQGRIVSIDELLMEVWGCTRESGGTSNQVWSCIKRLRRKIYTDTACKGIITTIGKKGYLLSL